MYEQFFGLAEKPFSVTPDTKYFYSSEQHEEALNSLIFAIEERKGFAVVTGEIGSGKTTVWHTLVNKLNPSTKIALITNTNLTPKQMMMAILDEFEVPYRQSWQKVKMLHALNNFLIDQISLGFNVVLIIDEAQNLNPSVLEEVRMLSNLETEREKLLQIVLMGQPELKDMLRQRRLTQLRQRISVYYHLYPLSAVETKEYITHRLGVAGLNKRALLDEFSFHKIYRYTQGVPRLINSLCDRALLTAFIKEKQVITTDIIDEVAKEMDPLLSDLDEPGEHAAARNEFVDKRSVSV